MRLFIVAGELSGDIHSANLIKELEKLVERRPNTFLSSEGGGEANEPPVRSVSLYGAGGTHLALLGQRQLATIDDLSAIGFFEAVKKIPLLLKLSKLFLKEIERVKPDLILLTDYTGFNLRFAKKLKGTRIPVVQLVSPQFWIWHYSRVYTLRECYRLVLTILPFEEEMLKKEGVNAKYIGHPVAETLNLKYGDREAFLGAHGLEGVQELICLAPGSRKREIDTLMPIMVRGALEYAALAEGVKPRFILARAASVEDGYLRRFIPKDLSVTLIGGETPDCLKYADRVWICSGTAALEAAILGTPMIILYRIRLIDELIGRLVTKLRMIGMPNIILGRLAVPELVGRRCNAKELVKCAKTVDFGQVREALAPFKEMFSQANPMKRAAEEVWKVLEERQHLSSFGGERK